MDTMQQFRDLCLEAGRSWFLDQEDAGYPISEGRQEEMLDDLHSTLCGGHGDAIWETLFNDVAEIMASLIPPNGA